MQQGLHFSLSLSLSLSPLLTSKLILLMAFVTTADQQAFAQKESWAIEIQTSDINPFANCTCFDVTFTITNFGDNEINNFAIDFLPKLGAYEFCVNPFEMFNNTGTTVGGIPGFGGHLAELWRSDEFSLDPLSTTTITARVRVIGFVTPLQRSIATRGVVGGVPGNFVVLQPIDPVYNAITIGTNPGSVNDLSVVATGGLNMLALPPGNTGQNVIINGQLNVDRTYTFGQNSRIFMGPDAAINVEGGNTFTLTGSTVARACFEQWEGIDVQGGATLNLDGVTNAGACSPPCEVKVMEAAKAVEANSPTAVVNAKSTAFINNYYGITSDGGNGSNLRIQDNLFTHSHRFGFGVRVSNLSNILYLHGNEYKRVNFGVNARNSNLIVIGEKMSDCSTGITARSENNHIMLLGNSEFEFMPTAVFVDNVAIEAKANVMTRVNRGFDLVEANNKNAFIIDNEINAYNLGISISDWKPQSTLNGFLVNDNTIEIQGFFGAGTGIWAENMTAPRKSVYFNNQITMNGGQDGIHINGGNWSTVAENTISLVGTNPMNGLNIENSFSPKQTCNSITGAGSTTLQEGMRFATNTHLKPSCNTVDNTIYGIHFLDQNLPTTMTGNSINGHLIGLRYEAGSRTGQQLHHSNRWLQTYSGGAYGAYHLGDVVDIQACQIIHDPGDPQLKTNEPQGQGGVSGLTYSLFKPESGSEFGCTGAACPPDTDDFIDSGNPADLITASTGFTLAGTYAAPQTWVAKRQLYRRIIATPGLLSANVAYQNFYNAEANTSVGGFEQLRANMEGLWVVAAATQAQLEADQASIRAKLLQLADVEAQLSANPSPSQLATLGSQRTALVQDIVSLQGGQASTLQSLQAARTSAANQLLATNAAIPAIQAHELMQRQVNAVALERVANAPAELTQAQVAVLTPIANTCPLEGGFAVYEARALLGDQANYDDDLLCQPAAPLKNPGEATVQALDYKLYPNPANGYALLELDRPSVGDGNVVLTNALGKVMMVQTIQKEDKSLVLFLDELPAGTYYVTVQTESGKNTKVLINLK
jgi:hypothetical protein